MFRSVAIGSNDIARSQAFYNATMGALGFPPAEPNHRGGLAYRRNGAMLVVLPPLNGEPATPANGGTIVLLAGDAAQVNAWQQAGVAAGGVAIEDPAGPRAYPSGQVYSAYLRDPDGNKLCACYPEA